MIKRLFPYVGEYKYYAMLTPVMVILEVIVDLYIPGLMQNIIDVGIADGDVRYVVMQGLGMIGLALLGVLFGALAGRFASVASTGYAANIRGELFHRVQDFSFGNVDKFSTSSLITRLTTDITYLQTSFMMIIRMLARAPVMLIGATLMAVSINGRLAMVFLVALPVLGAVVATVGLKAHKYFEAMFRRYDEMNASVQEDLIAIRVVKAFVRGDYENEKFRDTADVLRNAQMKAERLIVLIMPFMQLTMYGCIIAVLWFGGRQIIAGDMLTGELLRFISYIGQILMSLMMVAMASLTIIMSQASKDRVLEVLDETPDISDRGADPELRVADGSVSFSNVAFSYSGSEDNPTLTGINLNIRSGEKIGVIGGTGSAKTTLVQLIPRLYEALSGSVSVGGHDVREYTLANLRSAVAMVLQKNVLFSGTIRDNLLWGNENATQEEIEAACRAAQAHDFIMSFPEGYDTDLGQGGVNVSGGQKQRLCIARALLKKPKIIILDDSTSAVDTATDAKIREAFRTGLDDVTTIVIAQRISSVADADRIVVMNDGKIDAVGTHEELMASNAIYREVFESQEKGVA